MPNRFLWIDQYRWNIIGLAGLALVVHQICIFVRGFNLLTALVFLPVGASFFFVGWGMMFLLTGFILATPIGRASPRSVCYVLLFLSLFGGVASFLVSIISPFLTSPAQMSPTSLTPLDAGMILSAFRMYKKRVIELS